MSRKSIVTGDHDGSDAIIANGANNSFRVVANGIFEPYQTDQAKFGSDIFSDREHALAPADDNCGVGLPNIIRRSGEFGYY